MAQHHFTKVLTLSAAALALVVLGLAPQRSAVVEHAVIVQAATLQHALNAVTAVGGEVTHELRVIRSAGAKMTDAEIARLENLFPQMKLTLDRSVAVSGHKPKPDEETSFSPAAGAPKVVGARELHQRGITGRDVTVAVLDSGAWAWGPVATDDRGKQRSIHIYDAILDRESPKKFRDDFGHGSHITSIVASSAAENELGDLSGIAPGVNLVVVKAFDGTGEGTYADVIRGIDWILANKDQHDIRVLNLSFSAEPRSHYWDDPLNQAVMAAWEAGIVVVASAGNTGPDAMTIGVPGNVPYVITVGALSDNYTPEDPTDDFLASFSSAGPTYEGFVKPEIVAPGGHVHGVMQQSVELAVNYPEFHDPAKNYFTMSGTSQSAAVVSGVVALLLQEKPFLTPDEVKCQLMASADPARDLNGDLAYSIFQQGAGMVNAAAASASDTLGCANVGLDVTADLDGSAHYGGLANQDEAGNFYIMGMDGYLWADGYLWSNGYLWTESEFSSSGYLWADGYLWSDGYLWADGYLWSNSSFHSNNNKSKTASVNNWVGQE